MTLYLKYSPQTIDELDLEVVGETLKNIIKSGNIPHAFLFSGPKGGGKTSAARIIAKVVNCESSSTKLRGSEKIEPCNKCSQCVSITTGNNIDVVELDAASHRGVDEVRALRDAVKLAPAKAKNKVYIIDEAHMLTTEASNALLKTLEEPPGHVYFILATTNPEKLVDTIRSRTVSISFKKASTQELVRSLEKVAKGEKLKVDKETLEVIAKASNGSFRDATKILEQIIAEGKKLKKEEIEELLFQRKAFDIEVLLGHLKDRNSKAALEVVEKAAGAGVSVPNLLEATLSKLREGLLAKVGVGEGHLPGWEKGEIISLIKAFYLSLKEMAGVPLEQLPMEVAIVEWCGEESWDKARSRKPQEESSQLGQKDTDQKDKILSDVSGIVDKIAGPMGKLEEVTEEVWKRILS